MIHRSQKENEELIEKLVDALKALTNEIEEHHLNTFSRGDLLYKAKQALAKAGE